MERTIKPYKRILAMLVSIAIIVMMTPIAVLADGGPKATLDATSLEIAKGASKDLTAAFTGFTEDPDQGEWTLEANEGGIISKTGDNDSPTISITGVNCGFAKVKVTLKNVAKNESAEAICDVKVYDPALVSVSFANATKEMTVTDKATVNYTAAGEATTAKWSSSNPAVATVNATGEVEALTEGTATITVLLNEGFTNEYTASYELAVKPLPVTAINITESEIKLDMGKSSEKLEVTFTPNKASNKEIEWKSDDEDVATVADGVVTAGTTPGTATVTATAKGIAEGGSAVTATCTVTVYAAATGITGVDATKTIKVGANHTFTAAVTPSEANQAITWESSDNTVATVDETGKVVGEKAGEAIITATSGDGKITVECVFTVENEAVTGITLDGTDVTDGAVDGTLTIVPTITPSNATIKTVTWSSSNKNTATVTAEGVVTYHAPGTAVITAKSDSNPDVEATRNITVLGTPVTSVEIQDNEGTKIEDEVEVVLPLTGTNTKQLTAALNVGGSTPAVDTVTWSSNNTNAVTVDDTGLLTAKAPGTAIITVTTKDGGFEDTITVKVDGKNVTGVKIQIADEEITTYTLENGKKATFTAVLDPEDAAVQDVQWTVDPAGRVTFDDATSLTPEITAATPGVATVTVTTADGNKTASFTMNVTPAPTEIELSAEGLADGKLKLESGATATFSAKVKPDADEENNVPAANQEVVWALVDSATKVISISDTGVVTALKSGTASIKATSKSDATISATCEVTVFVAAKSVTVHKDTAEGAVVTDFDMVQADTATVVAVVGPEGVTDDTVTWTAEPSGVVSFSAADVKSPTITADAAGVATVTVKTNDGDFEKSFEITVRPLPDGVTMDPETLALAPDETATITAIVGPAADGETPAAAQTVEWESSDETKATVDQNGAVTAVADGTAAITATTPNGKVGTTTVTVRTLVSEITLDKTEVTLKLDADDAAAAKIKLNATVKPDEATDDTVEWTSSDEAIATVDDEGNVTAVAVGTTTITVEAKDGSGKKAECVVHVVIPVKSVALEDDFALFIGEGKKMAAPTILPADATDKTVVWKTSDASVVSVDQNGNIDTYKVGKATITVTTNDGRKEATCEVTVKPIKVTGVTLDKDVLTLTEGDKALLVATVAPANATDKAVTWTSSDVKVATVANGMVTAVKEGTVKITVTTKDGSIKETCAVTIKAKAVEKPTVPGYKPNGTANSALSTLPKGSKLVMAEPKTEHIIAMSAAANAYKGELALVTDLTLVDAAGKAVAPDANTVVRIDITGVTAKDAVIIAHLPAGKTNWEYFAGTSYEGYVTFKAKSFSPYAVILQKNAITPPAKPTTPPAGGGTTTTPAPTTTTALSPKTGVY